MKSLNELKGKENLNAFDNSILSYMEYLHPYVKHRLHVAESKGILPKNLYNSTGIIDDAILKMYEDRTEKESSNSKILLFKTVNEVLKDTLAKEIENSNTENSDDFLKGELQSLEIEFFVDADNETILYKDLDDISYNKNQQNNFDEVYTDEDSNKAVINDFNLHNEVYHSDSETVGRFYNLLPECVSNIVDLSVFGKLSPKEIAEIHDVEEAKIAKVVENAKDSFKAHMH
ncbi:hypothetical protein [Galbibacter mesophilus]|uniref:hypothetical protein n=1 Tax=Galbibacter mesophilus TaxID=379069 RepID=UPI00191FE0DD|nr:hypothetical protein [Galbibacter mesophilus]MCM5662199.1 hypothetical protein [Galbibacter mesophilus]